MKGQFLDAVLRYPLNGIEVCVEGRDDIPCALAGPDGKISLPVPPNLEMMLKCSMPLHITTYMTMKTPTESFDVGVFRLLEQSTADLFSAMAGSPRDDTKGILLVNAYDDFEKREVRVAEFTAAIEASAARGPVYGAGAAFPNPSLKASTDGGPAGFYAVPPGDSTVTIAHPSRACAAGFGWPEAQPTRLRTRVFAGAMSTVTWVCPP